jgi:hypothetical protein
MEQPVSVLFAVTGVGVVTFLAARDRILRLKP